MNVVRKQILNFLFFSFLVSCTGASIDSITAVVDGDLQSKKIKFETTNDGAGSEVSSINTWDRSSSISIFSVARNDSGEFLGNETVSWELQGSMGTLTVLEGGKKADFNPTGAGSGKIVVRVDGKEFSLDVVVTANTLPSVSVTEPAGADDTVALNSSFNIQWTDNDPEENATVSLYYKHSTGGACDTGTLIVDSLQEDLDGASDAYNWDLTGVAGGDIYICSRISDGMGFVDSWSSDPLKVDAPPTISLTAPTGNDDVVTAGATLAIGFTASDVDSDAEIKLYRMTTNSGDCAATGSLIATLAEDSAGSSYNYDTSGVGSGRYYICATIKDTTNTLVTDFSDYFDVNGVCTWTGASSTDFSLPANWSGCSGAVPTATDKVIFPIGAGNQPTITANSEVESIVAGTGGGTITINSGVSLEIKATTSAINSDISFVGASSTCTDCRLTLNAGVSVVNGATLTFGKGLFVYLNGSTPEFKVGSSTEHGHLRFEGGTVEAEKPRFDANGTWGFSGFDIEGTATNKSSIYSDGVVIELYGGNNNWAKGFDFIAHYQIKKMDNITFKNNRGSSAENRSSEFDFETCATGQFDDLSWDNIVFTDYKDNANFPRGHNVIGSNCSGIGPITFNNATGFGYGSIYELDPNNIFNWQNETAANCVWTGAVDTDWKNAGNWSSCSNGRNSYPDQFDTARIPSAPANQPTVSGGVAVQEIATGSGGGTVTIDNTRLFLLTGKIRSDVTFKGVTDNCTKCVIAASELEITDNSTTTLYRGIHMGVHSQSRILVGSSTSPGHLVTNPGSTDTSVWPKLASYYYYFTGVKVEGVDAANRSSIDFNGVKFDRAYNTSHKNVHLSNHTEIKGLDNVYFGTSNNWNMKGHHLYVEDCSTTLFTDTNWTEIDFVRDVDGYNVELNNCAGQGAGSINISSFTSGSNLGYGAAKSKDDDGVLVWAP